MFFKTYRANTERARVLHYLRVKALENFLEESITFYVKLETGELSFETDTLNQDVPFINARYAVHGLELLSSRVGFYEEVRPVTDSVVNRHLDWFLDWLASAELHAKNQQNQQSHAASFAAAAQFVYELKHPQPKQEFIVLRPEMFH